MTFEEFTSLLNLSKAVSEVVPNFRETRNIGVEVGNMKPLK